MDDGIVDVLWMTGHCDPMMPMDIQWEGHASNYVTYFNLKRNLNRTNNDKYADLNMFIGNMEIQINFGKNVGKVNARKKMPNMLLPVLFGKEKLCSYLLCDLHQ